MKKQFPTFGHLFLILFLFVLFSLPFGLIQSFTPKSWIAWMMLLGYAVPMYLTIWATRRIFDKQSHFNYAPKHLMILPVIIIVAYAFLVVGEFTVFLLPKPTGIWKKLFDMLNETITQVFNYPLAGFLMVVVAAPILEETLFRGVILKALLKKYAPFKAIMISAIAFGIFHLNPWQFLYATTLGLLLGYIYWKTRSLFYPIIIHMILNGTAFFAAHFAKVDAEQGIVEQLSGENLQKYLILVSMALVIIIMSYYFLENYFRNTSQELVLATQNPHKIAEIKKIMPSNIYLKSLKDIQFKGDLKETGQTLEENALQKLHQITRAYDVDALADDTGLEVDELNGAPGVYSARYAGEQATYADNVEKLLSEMKDKQNRAAQFKTVIAYSQGHKEYMATGILKGSIATQPRGNGGFGYDSVFIPEGYNQTFAEMGEAEKNKISHRAIALDELKKMINTLNK